MAVQVVLVRPWTDGHGGAGCCGGDAGSGICLERREDEPRHHDDEVGLVAECYLRLREQVPGVDVQIVTASNTAYLLPRVFGSVLRRRGLRAALRETNRATTAGSLLVGGERVGDVTVLGVDGVVEAVRRRAGPLPA
jgi:hypothetical protein